MELKEARMNSFNLEWWQIIIIIAVVTFCIVIAMYFMKRWKFRADVYSLQGKKMLELNPVEVATQEVQNKYDKINNEIERVPETKETTKLSYIMLIQQAILLGSERIELLKVATFQDQENAACARMEQIRHILQRIHTTVLDKQKNGEPLEFLDEVSYLIYTGLVKEYCVQIINTLKERFKENHLDTKDDEDFEDYYKAHIASYCDIWISTMNDCYPSTLCPSRKILLYEFTSNLQKVYTLYESCFQEARKISIRNKKASEAKEKMFQERLKGVVQTEHLITFW
jgi:hypothetical protein